MSATLGKRSLCRRYVIGVEAWYHSFPSIAILTVLVNLTSYFVEVY